MAINMDNIIRMQDMYLSVADAQRYRADIVAQERRQEETRQRIAGELGYSAVYDFVPLTEQRIPIRDLDSSRGY